jgi:hypothetical protein
MNRSTRRTVRTAGTVAALAALVVSGASPALASTRSGQTLDVTVSGRTSTCRGDVSATDKTCYVTSFRAGTENGRTIGFWEMTTERYNPDPADRDGKTYVSDVLCEGPVTAVRHYGFIELSARLDTCDVALGTAKAGPYRLQAVVDEAGTTAASRVDWRLHRYSLFASVQPD